MVVRECWKDDDESLWGRSWLDRPATQNPLTDGHQNLRGWLCRAYQLPDKILSWSVQGFRFCACVLFFGYLRWSAAEMPAPVFTRTSSKDEISPMKCFWGSQNHNLIFIQPFSLEVITGGAVWFLQLPRCLLMQVRREQSVLLVQTFKQFNTGPDISVWRPWAGSLLEAPTRPQVL